uniref:Uncharacterized protein n=1 Tax=Rhizophora mucronata TaxID=61149 RepID=A0A2P2P967_RHIMU
MQNMASFTYTCSNSISNCQYLLLNQPVPNHITKNMNSSLA